MVEKRLEKEKITLEAFEPRYNEHSTDIAKLLHIVFVVLMAIPIMIVNFSRERYFVDHLTTSLEFNIVTDPDGYYRYPLDYWIARFFILLIDPYNAVNFE